MLNRPFKIWPYALVLAGFYLMIPPTHRGIASVTGADEVYLSGVLLSYLLAINPGFTFLLSAVAGYRNGYAWMLIPLTALAWIPATFVVYNSSALPYGLAYAFFAAFGLLVGWATRWAFTWSSQRH